MDVDMVKEGQYFWNVLANSYSEGVDGIQQLLSNELFEFNPLVDRIEVNGDLALIPSSSYDGFSSRNEFPISNAFDEDEDYVKQRYQQYMKNWKQFVDIVPTSENTTLEDPMTSDVPCTSDFDLRKYLHDSPEKPKRKAWGAGVKRIDLKARRYIIDSDGVEGSLEEELNDESDEEDVDEDAEEVDVVTISENDGDSLKLLKEETGNFKPIEKQGTSAALEAQDVKTLLEQFEAADIPDMDSVEQDLKTLTKAPIQFLHNILENAIVETKPKTVMVKQEPLDVDEQEANIKSELVDSGFSDTSSPVNIKVEEPVQVKKEKRDGKQNENVKIKLENSKSATPPYKQKEYSSPKYPIKKEFPIKNKCPVKKEYPTKNEYPAKKECPTKTEYPVKKEYPIKKECPLKNEVPRVKQTLSTTSTPHDAKHKQIRDSLPQELIDRIKESRKRKTISIIEPIMPNKKQKVNHKTHEQNNKANKHDTAHSSVSSTTFEVPGLSKKLNTISSPYSTPLEAKTDISQKIVSQVNTVYLDHNYAQKFNVYSMCHKKDSGFESTEEEEEKQVIGTQPIVKNADGRMMVSLLKVNTIRTEQAKKRKLNLEEYKKRREGVLKSQNSSQTSSPLSSTCSSPVPEDESVRLQRHQEKLMRMAMEVLNTPAKSDRKQQPVPMTALKIAPKVVVPPNIEKKTMVSVGINTVLQCKNKLDPLAPIEQLEGIRPLLASASNRINSSSLITSVIENIPRIISTCTVADTNVNQVEKSAEHGEDKTIVYLPKNRTPATKCDFAVQTDLSFENDLTKQITRIISSPTSSSSNTDGPCGSSSNNKASPASSSGNNRESFSGSSNGNSGSPSSSLISNNENLSSCPSSSKDSPSSILSSNRENSSSKRKSRSISSSSSRESPRYKRRRKSSEHSDYSSRSSSSISSPRYSSGSSYSSRSRSRSRSPSFTSRLSTKARYQARKIREQERLREVEERRVIYIGGLLPTMTREDLRRLFHKFGHITNVSLHSRDQGDNYGFVTFAKKSDAYDAFEARNIDSCLKHYDISFGGRRIFCQTLYADLDYMPDEVPGYPVHRAPQESFDALLREVQEQMRKRRV